MTDENDKNDVSRIPENGQGGQRSPWVWRRHDPLVDAGGYDVRRQARELADHARRAGFEVVGVFTDACDDGAASASPLPEGRGKGGRPPVRRSRPVAMGYVFAVSNRDAREKTDACVEYARASGFGETLRVLADAGDGFETLLGRPAMRWLLSAIEGGDVHVVVVDCFWRLPWDDNGNVGFDRHILEGRLELHDACFGRVGPEQVRSRASLGLHGLVRCSARRPKSPRAPKP